MVIEKIKSDASQRRTEKGEETTVAQSTTEIWPGYKKRILHHEVVWQGPGTQRGRRILPAFGVFETHLETALNNQTYLRFQQEKGLDDPLRSLPTYISVLLNVIQTTQYFTEERQICVFPGDVSLQHDSARDMKA